MYGGITDSTFSTQFWLLKLSEENGKKNEAESVVVSGKWIDLRLQNMLSDEEIAINEHIALVIANNNQIMMEVNNQENGDDEDDEIPGIELPYSETASNSYTGFTPEDSPPLRIKYQMPAGRWSHTMLYYNHYIILYGGSRPGNCFGDVWVASEKEILGES